MHELGITQELVKLLLAECENRGIPRVNKAYISVGILTTYKPEPIRYFFEEIRKTHRELSGTRLVFDEVKGKMHCKKCDTEHEIEHEFFCPECHSRDFEITEGKEITIKKIEV